MPEKRLSAYRIMWLFVFFDLPVTTKSERRFATRFRKNLIKDGFTMMQYSVYCRHCASAESADVHTKRVISFIGEKGQVSIMRITDKQYAQIINYWGCKNDPLDPQPQQLELF